MQKASDLELPTKISLRASESLLTSEKNLSLRITTNSQKFASNSQFSSQKTDLFLTSERLIFESRAVDGAIFSFFAAFVNVSSISTCEGFLLVKTLSTLENEINGFFETDFLQEKLVFDEFLKTFDEKEIEIDANLQISNFADFSRKNALFEQIKGILNEQDQEGEAEGEDGQEGEGESAHLDAAFIEEDFVTRDNLEAFLSAQKSNKNDL